MGLGDINIFKKAESFLREKGSEFVDGAKQAYSDIVSEGTKTLQDVLPEGMRQPISAISTGVTQLGRDAIDFFDPVSYGADLIADAARIMAPEHQLNKVIGLTELMRGSDSAKDEGMKRLGESALDETLLAAQGGLLLLPSGHVAAKSAGKLLKTGVKSAKKEFKAVKSLPKTDPNRVMARQQLTRQKTKYHAGRMAARTAAKTADQFGRDILTDQRSKLKYAHLGKFTPLKKRDWSKFGQDHLPDGVQPLGNSGPVKKR